MRTTHEGPTPHRRNGSTTTLRAALTGVAALLLSGGAARAQAPPAPSPTPPESVTPEQLLQRLKATEELNQKLLQKVEQLSSQVEKLSNSKSNASDGETKPDDGRAESARETPDANDDDGDGPSRRFERGVGAQGAEGRAFEPENRYRGKDKIPRRKAIVEFAEGLEFRSDDDEFKLQFHDLTQAELRAFPQSNQGLIHTSFFIPRQRWYFTGRVTKNIEYYTVINRGYGSLDLLDAFLTFRYDERLRMRIGRMKTPYLYEYFEIAEGDLIAPERSLYAGNLATNRQLGAMFLGELFKNHMSYAVGAFNGGRRSFEDTNSAKDVFLFVNSRPFLKPGTPLTGSDSKSKNRPNQSIGGNAGGEADNGEPGLLNYLNLGGSLNAGYENSAPQPFVFRTANDETSSSAAGILSPSFLALNSNVRETGERMQWSAHTAWYYRNFFVLAEYGGGFGSYSTLNHDATNTRVPYQGWEITGSWFVTGERITRRVNVVKPIKDFRIRNGKISGPGAVEVYARYADINIGRNVFTAGFADPNLWTNQAQTVDIGLNWYLNFYTKIYLDWQHALFGEPVTRGNNQWMGSSDLFWLRFQLFF